MAGLGMGPVMPIPSDSNTHARMSREALHETDFTKRT
jgi:hypothetical protein